MITMEELQGYPVADDKEIRDAHNKAVSLIEHNVDEFCGLLMRVTKTIN